LHGTDQPLEPILCGAAGRLVIPTDLFANNTADRPERLNIFRVTDDHADNVYIAVRPGGLNQKQPAFAATVFCAQPQQHGIIRKVPQNLNDLHEVVVRAGLDLLGELKARLKNWQLDQQLMASPLVIITLLPKTRSQDGGVEAHDICAFVTDKPVAEIGQSLGIWDIKNGHLGTIIGGGDGRGDDVHLDMLDPTFALSRLRAALLNGLTSGHTSRIAAVGAGALGSQVIVKLIRAGFGQWTVIDDDFVLPHNVARHELTSNAVGLRKATALACWANSVLEDRNVVRPIVANVLEPRAQADAVAAALSDADVIVDFSASVAVGRRLAADPQAKGRRISFFLNPTGTDLVLLAEDKARTSPLDSLEMLYYRAVANDPELASHMGRDDGPIRYARSCRDVTSIVPEELVGLHSAIGSRSVRVPSSRSPTPSGSPSSE
jgi:hypothetical protein